MPVFMHKQRINNKNILPLNVASLDPFFTLKSLHNLHASVSPPPYNLPHNKKKSPLLLLIPKAFNIENWHA